MPPESDREHEETPRAAITLPIETHTLVPHVRSHAARLKKLEDSARNVTKAVDVVLARALLNIKDEVKKQIQSEIGDIKESLGAQDKVLLQIKGAGKLIALVAAIATFLGAISEIISLAKGH